MDDSFSEKSFSSWKDKVLFTPGPLTTSRTVKQAMLRDLGSRDTEFIRIVSEIRTRLVALGGGNPKDYTAIPMQGSGTFGLEAVVGSTIPPGRKILVGINGAYGRRIARIAEVLNIPAVKLDFSENERVDHHAVADALAKDPGIFLVAVCHCETTSGILNSIESIGKVVAEAGRAFFVDAMSSFGAVPIDLEGCAIDFLVSSSNKCIEGVPGFCFILAKRISLQASEGFARSLSLDLYDQYTGLEKSGQFRFTPPTHALLAFHQALLELEAEGGVTSRANRYSQNHQVLVRGMRAMGFKEYLRPEDQGPIITSFRCPEDPNFDFERFYGNLSRRDYVIYPGKVGNADCFRIGSIGRIFESDVLDLLAAIRGVMDEMGFRP